MNYRHAFHAGNFADLLKHAVLLDLMERLTALPGALSVIDTHAGAGIYDLQGDEATRSAEAEAGIGRLLDSSDAPPVFRPLQEAVKALSPDGRLYPGSPHLIASGLRPGDSYLGCELRPDDAERLRQTLRPFPGARAMQSDGYATAVRQTSKGRALVVIDPPFEQADDYERTSQTITAILKQNPKTVLAVWLPIKDLETLDAFRRGLTLRGASAFLAEARLRPLTDPMKMNGCAMLVIGAPKPAEAAARSAADWIVRTLGQAGGKATVVAA